ncbi:hypothetical protein QVD17_10365 [Tagetes erecta]|uniref:Receptor-like serine/threonine-protein kinase n=1 Tax=Tagetes erecta TaxID=13708 RepID=A0AAD8NZF8_TARER|nr:hypothetical protein QVD17_10365 [Tagetes erecta]
MASLFLFHVVSTLVLLLSKTPLLLSSTISLSQPSVLKPGSSLSVENKNDFLISPNGLFTAGFYAVGENAYCFSVWFTKPLRDKSHTIVWMANRDVPVNGKRSKLSLLKTGNLVLRDASQPLPIWTTNIINSKEPAQLIMNNTGNLYLENQDNQTIWQSFGSPTDTLLTLQPLTKDTPLVSSRSFTNYSSGLYKLYFDSDNVIRLAFSGPNVAGTFWPDPMITAWASGRSTWASRRTATLDLSGHFVSSDSLFFNTSDAENQFAIRRLTLDVDGNFRVYSLDETRGVWNVTWQAISDTCRVHGICGENSTCSVIPGTGRKCSCIPNHTMIDQTDWSRGCKPEFNTTLCGNNEDEFLHFPNYDFYGYEARFVRNTTLKECKKVCLGICNCKGFHYNFETTGYFSCYAKFRLINGFRTVSSNGSMYLKVPKSISPLSKSKRIVQGESLICRKKLTTILLDRAYEKTPKNGSVKSLMIFTYVFGALEAICIIYFFYITRKPSTTRESYLQAATGFQRFSYAELKRATNNFNKEIGRGGGGIVYRGEFSDNRVAAVKLLKEYSKSPAGDQSVESKGRLDIWMKEKMMAAGGTKEWIEEVVDVTVGGKYDTSKMEILIKVALLCSDEDKDARPTMSQFVTLINYTADMAAGGTEEWIEEVVDVTIDGKYDSSKLEISD